MNCADAQETGSPTSATIALPRLPELPQLVNMVDALAPVLSAVGTPEFVASLYECVVRFVDCDALHLERSSADSPAFEVDWIGSHGTRPDDIRRIMQVYFERFVQRDKAVMRQERGEDITLTQISVYGIEDVELRHKVYDAGDIHDECMLVRTAQGESYLISVCRSRRLPAFSIRELSVLRQLGHLLLPLAALHGRVPDAAQGGAPARSTGSDALAAYFAQQRVNLSSREATVCRAFLQGMTTDSVARALGVKQSTVETYARRAFAKLGVASRRELLALVYA
ncbi:helix-turn-helix transcriptional regulator [Paraburkholderia kururiensis]|uniref:helix-turn-helix transcriptional regulator n=1 Tax=Paraburkholderia kururiensis TaxID=984307 RepID=UPI0018F66AF0|nr:helix-turn-helix transcriptional regulator [Paraburkholderia kururiensis]